LFLILSGAILVIAGISIYSYFNLSRPSLPRIAVSPRSYDFGVIPYRAVKKSFTIRNVGGSPLLITGISTSCGCTSAEIGSTSAEIGREELLPGEKTELMVTFDPNLMEERLEGEVYRVVYVRSNDPRQPEVEIEIRATLKEDDESQAD